MSLSDHRRHRHLRAAMRAMVALLDVTDVRPQMLKQRPQLLCTVSRVDGERADDAVAISVIDHRDINVDVVRLDCQLMQLMLRLGNMVEVEKLLDVHLNRDDGVVIAVAGADDADGWLLRRRQQQPLLIAGVGDAEMTIEMTMMWFDSGQLYQIRLVNFVHQMVTKLRRL